MEIEIVDKEMEVIAKGEGRTLKAAITDALGNDDWYSDNVEGYQLVNKFSTGEHIGLAIRRK